MRTLCILRFLMRSGGKAPESFLQSAMYILQEAGGEELESIFYLDRWGPRSREIFENILRLESEGKITIQGDASGLVISIAPQGEDFICKGGRWGGHFYDVPPVRIPEKLIDSVLTLFGSGDLRIESLGLALYFLQAASVTDILEMIQKAKKDGSISPGVDEREIVKSYKRLKRTKLSLD